MSPGRSAQRPQVIVIEDLVDISDAVEHTNDVHTIRKRKVEDDLTTKDGPATQVLAQLVTNPSQERIFGEHAELLADQIKE